MSIQLGGSITIIHDAIDVSPLFPLIIVLLPLSYHYLIVITVLVLFITLLQSLLVNNHGIHLLAVLFIPENKLYE